MVFPEELDPKTSIAGLNAIALFERIKINQSFSARVFGSLAEKKSDEFALTGGSWQMSVLIDAGWQHFE
jgi:hypothetical protein